MKVFDYSNKEVYEGINIPERFRSDGELFILCRTYEILMLRDVFGFDKSTVSTCTDLDESVRYADFNGYDFISMVHIEMSEDSFALREINLYVSAKYLVLVMPEHDSPRLAEMEIKLLDAAKLMDEHTERINRLYFSIFHYLLADFSDMLETLEDRMQKLSEEIVSSVRQTQFAQINNMRNMAYAVKKHLRALSYIGEQILVDENNIISKNRQRYFRNVDTRFKKLYDFAESLYDFCGEMLYTYDSRLGMKTNETVNKLTALTLFFGPPTVIAGIYGMNFDLMPELRWAFGYPLALVVMAAVSFIIYFVLKKKKWL